MSNIKNHKLTFSTADSKKVEVLSHFGTKGYVIEQIQHDINGMKKNSFHPKTVKPSHDLDIDNAFHCITSEFISDGAVLKGSNMSFSVPIEFDHLDVNKQQTVIKVNAGNIAEYVENDAFVATALPVTRIDAIICFDSTAKNVISVNIKDDLPIVSPAVMATLSTIYRLLPSMPVIVEASVLNNDKILFKDILYYGNKSLSNSSFKERVSLLTDIFDNKSLNASVAMCALTALDKKNIVEAATKNGFDLLFWEDDNLINNSEIYMTNSRATTRLQVMDINKFNNTAKLGAYVSGAPIEVTTADLNESIEISPLDIVLVTYTDAVIGELINTEIKEKIAGEDEVNLDPILAHKLGYAPKPVIVKNSTVKSNFNLNDINTKK